MLLEGPMGTAERAPIAPQFAAGVDCWLMTLPHQAPGGAWDQYVLQTITLADMPGFPPAKKVDPGNTHEMICQTLDPARRWTAQDSGAFGVMGRPNVVVQFRVRSDDMAREVTEMVARSCVEGMLIAESTVIIFPVNADGTLDTSEGKGQEKLILQVLQMWKQTVVTLAEHAMTGGHHGTQN